MPSYEQTPKSGLYHRPLFARRTNSDVIESISQNYPGRASASPVIDLFVTLLSMGLHGYKRLLDERQRLTGIFRRRLEEVANTFDERILNCPRNTISFGLTLDKLVVLDLDSTTHDEGSEILQRQNEHNRHITKFGSMLFTRCISGTRIVPASSQGTKRNQFRDIPFKDMVARMTNTPILT